MGDSKIRLGILISGRGSNFKAILDREHSGFFRNLGVGCVVSDVPEAAGLDIARAAGIAAVGLRPREFPCKADYENAVAAVLEGHGVGLIALAGYMRLVGPTLLERFAGRIVNIHPSLLPSFPGLHAQQQAVEHGSAHQRLHRAFRGRRTRQRADHRPAGGGGPAG